MGKKTLVPSFLENNIANLYFIPHFTSEGKFAYFREQIQNGRRTGQWVEVDVWKKTDAPCPIPEAPAAQDHAPFPAPLSAESMGAERFLYYDEKNSVMYFTARGKEIHTDPEHEYVYKMKTDTMEAKLISKTKGHHQVYFAPDGSYFLDTVSKADQPPETVACDPDGNPIVNICSCDISLVEDRMTFPLGLGSGWDMDCMLFIPKKFDPEKRFPVSVVTEKPPVSFEQMVCSSNYYQALSDAGWVSIVSQNGMNAARAAAEKYPFLDRDRMYPFGEGECASAVETIKSCEIK